MDKVPNAETLQALEETKEPSELKTYLNVDVMFKELWRSKDENSNM